MNTQDTPIHVRLWHREFWLMAIANLLLTCSVYALIPVLPTWMLAEGFTLKQTGLAMGIFAIGMFLPGPFCSYLVQRYRRNWVCMLAISAMTAAFCLMFYEEAASYGSLLALRLLLGASFGLSQMVLSSTLIIDASESSQRTEANYSAAWFGRFALSLGPLAGLVVYGMRGFEDVLMFSIACAAVSIMLILMVPFPFRTPGDHVSVLSLDRFFLVKGIPLFLCLASITAILGLLMAAPLPRMFYAMLMAGFLMSLMAKHFVFKDAELKSEVVTGLLVIIAALLLMLFRQNIGIVRLVAPLFVGFGAGTIGSRFILYFIKLSRHCQRGTSQSTFMLAWEGGIAFGIGVGYYFLWGNTSSLMKASLLVAVFVLAVYVLYLHDWFVVHKNR